MRNTGEVLAVQGRKMQGSEENGPVDDPPLEVSEERLLPSPGIIALLAVLSVAALIIHQKK